MTFRNISPPPQIQQTDNILISTLIYSFKVCFITRILFPRFFLNVILVNYGSITYCFKSIKQESHFGELHHLAAFLEKTNNKPVSQML